MLDDSYPARLKSKADHFINRATRGLDIDKADIFANLDWTRDADLDGYFGDLIRAKALTPKQVAAERENVRRQSKLADAVGGEVSTPCEFVTRLFERDALTVNWKGAVRDASGRFEILPDLQRRARMRAVELGAPWKREDINDAVEAWHELAVKSRPATVHAALAERAPFDWRALAVACFDTDNPDLVAAVLKKFVHSVRRKIVNLPVTYHLMPILHGVQGGGKTFFFQRFLAPIAEGVAYSDLQQITDERNIGLWRCPIIVLDEMAKAAKADVETIKHVVTAETLDRRPMRSNATVEVPNCATLIGASNHRLAEIVRDETGNRRFAELVFRRPPEGFLDTLDFNAAWRSVQPEDADPMADFREDLAEIQAQDRLVGPVEDWLRHCSTIPMRAVEVSRNGDRVLTTAGLYRSFLDRRESVTSGIDYQSRSQQAFAVELRRITETFPELGLSKVRWEEGVRWLLSEAGTKRLAASAD